LKYFISSLNAEKAVRTNCTFKGYGSHTTYYTAFGNIL